MFRRVVAVVIIVLLVGAAIFMVLAYRCMNGLPVPREAAALVTPGMTMGEVRSVLGEPSTIRTVGDHVVVEWVYEGWMLWTFYTVRFDTEGKVTEAEYGD